MKKYYLDIDLEKIEELKSLEIVNIKKIHRIKFKKFITDLYIRSDADDISKLSQSNMYEYFTSNFYRKLYKNQLPLENQIFNTISERLTIGNNIDKTVSQYLLHIDFKRYLENNSVNLVPYEVKKENTKNTLVNYITIDRKYLKNLINNLEKNQPLTDEDLKQILFFKIILKSLNKDTNKLKLVYNIKPAGRLYSQYSHIKKEIRNHLLNGYTEFDISTASFQWMYDTSLHIDNTKQYPLLKEFIQNKKEIRYKLADELNTTYEVIKGIITSIGFGAKTEESYYEFFDFEVLEVIKEPQNAIEKILYENDIPQSKWNDSVLIQNFVKEIKDCKKVVSKYFKEKYYNPKTKIFNLNNKKLQFKKQFNESRVLSFIYQYYESNFLLSMVDTYKKYTKNKDVFLLHDALYVKENIPIEVLENSKQNLEFKINWKLEKE
jgi:hypothetical protein